MPDGPTIKRRYQSAQPEHGQVIRLLDDEPAVLEGRTKFPRLVRDPGISEWVLKSGQHNRKLGSHVTRRRWKGFPIFSLTLEERATCPRSCQQWTICYGNHVSQFKAYRYRHGPALEQELERELTILSAEAATRRGFVVRLHTLGDFYSVEYVRLWEKWLDQFPALHCFGFTARGQGDPIGAEVIRLRETRWDRFAIRSSNATGSRSAGVIPHGAEHPDPVSAIVCPAETGRTDCCGTCGLCWSMGEKQVVFVEH